VPDVSEKHWTENQLLASLLAKDRERLLTGMETLTVFFKEVIHTPAADIAYVYFPIDCIVVLVSSVDPEATVEVGLIGSEGMVGTAVLLGAKHATSRALVQTEGKALRLPATSLKRELSRSAALRAGLLPYAHALEAQSAQLAACHRFHTPHARLIRWLLMTRDRSQRDDIKITQSFIAHLLATRRATITDAANELQKEGLIRCSRGNIRILNRAALESAACTCYEVLKSRRHKSDK
jgi:CRP-like cAMP-binding protein